MTVSTLSPTRVRRRSRSFRAGGTALALVLVIAALFLFSLCYGSVVLPLGEVLRALTGQPVSSSTIFILDELRLDRAGAAVLVGLALGTSGTIFQRLLGNPLASPDFLGVTAGAGTAAVAAIVMWQATATEVSVASLVGGAICAAAIYLLAWRGGISGYRFVLIGIGVAAVCQSITSYLVARARFQDAREATSWLIGSIGMASRGEIQTLAIALVVLLPVIAVVSRRLLNLELSEDTARSLGSRIQLDRLVAVTCAVILASLATVAAGPIAFVALMAGPIAAALLGRAGNRVWAAALVGAVLVQVCDLAAQNALAWPISTGVVTGFVGAPYIAWLLISANRKGVGG